MLDIFGTAQRGPRGRHPVGSPGDWRFKLPLLSQAGGKGGQVRGPARPGRRAAGYGLTSRTFELIFGGVMESVGREERKKPTSVQAFHQVPRGGPTWSLATRDPDPATRLFARYVQRTEASEALDFDAFVVDRMAHCFPSAVANSRAQTTREVLAIPESELSPGICTVGCDQIQTKARATR